MHAHCPIIQRVEYPCSVSKIIEKIENVFNLITFNIKSSPTTEIYRDSENLRVWTYGCVCVLRVTGGVV